jgi:hypothetical protein
MQPERTLDQRLTAAKRDVEMWHESATNLD